MENVPPGANNDGLTFPDDSLRPKRNAWASRQKRSPALNTKTNADSEDEGSLNDSGLLTPPSSQTQENEIDPTRMLFSPPPEEMLRNVRSPASRAHSVPVQHPFTPSLLAEPPAPTTSKRKRNAHNRSASHSAIDSFANDSSAASVVVTEATPNPKPRKQTKRGSPSRPSAEPLEEPSTPTRASQRRSQSPSKRTLFRSPHHANPNADYIPPLLDLSRQSISARRRSATPIPPYEPPQERFTPPREIVHTPPRATHSPERMSKSSKRKSTAPKSSKKLVLTIKKEPPEIDLSLPPPPASPSDDPLLLKGQPRRPKPHDQSIITPASIRSRETPSIVSSSASPPGRPRAVQLPELDASMDVGMLSTDDDMDDSFAAGPPLFDFTNVPDDGDIWTDDDNDNEDDFDQTGEYTGRFKVLTVPTKMDPPSSCTRGRQDAWGNPSSPYPGVPRRRSLPGSSSPPLRAGPDEGGVAPEENPDEEDVFFLDSPANTEGAARAEFEEGSSQQRLYARGEPEADDEPAGSHQVSARSPKGSPSPLPIVDVSHVDYEHQEADHHVRFAAGASAATYEDLSMELEDESFDTSQTEASTFQIQQQDVHERRTEEPGQDPHDSSDEETVDRELSRPPEPDADWDDEDRDARPKAPAIPTPPRVFATPARSMSPSARPRGFLSITSPLRRLKSPEAQAFQTRSTSPMPSIQSVFATPTPTGPQKGYEEQVAPEASGSQIRVEDLEDPDQPIEERAVDDGPQNSQAYAATDVEDDSGDESEELDEGVIKVSSEDPRVAARAVAILKMHNYGFVVQDPSRRRHSSVDSAVRKARRKSTLEGGVGKHGTPVRRRRTLGGIVGDKVFIPGSPLITVPQLLEDAERAVERRLQTPSRGADCADASFKLPLPLDRPVFETPGPRQRVHARPAFDAAGPRAWTKDDWKLLDACFTDERLSLGSNKRIGEAVLAPVDDIVVDRVVDRFLDQCGSVPVDECWPSWTREDLSRRVLALQKKQRAGKGAPPTPSGRFGSVALSEVPDFTPLPSRQSSMQPGLERNGSASFFSKPPVPASLLAPRYSHLLDEAVAISRNESGWTSTSTPVAYRSASVPVAEQREISLPPQSPATAQRAESEVPTASTAADTSSADIPPSQSITSRMKGFFFSYLPRASKARAQPKTAPKPAHPGLPIPPPEVFQKPRGPIATPVSKPPNKPTHPKDLVQLQHAPPPKPSRIPRPAQQPPRRLVELHHVPPPEPSEGRPRSALSMLDRRSSSGSVKDLVKGFESLEKQQAKEKVDEATRLKRARSVGEWAKTAGVQGGARAQQNARPVWK